MNWKSFDDFFRPRFLMRERYGMFEVYEKQNDVDRVWHSFDNKQDAQIMLHHLKMISVKELYGVLFLD